MHAKNILCRAPNKGRFAQQIGVEKIKRSEYLQRAMRANHPQSDKNCLCNILLSLLNLPN